MPPVADAVRLVNNDTVQQVPAVQIMQRPHEDIAACNLLGGDEKNLNIWPPQFVQHLSLRLPVPPSTHVCALDLGDVQMENLRNAS